SLVKATGAIWNLASRRLIRLDASWSVRSRRGWRGRWVDRCAVPVLVGFTVDEAPHVEPRSRVGFRGIARVFHFAWRDDDNEIALGDHGHDFGFRQVLGN